MGIKVEMGPASRFLERDKKTQACLLTCVCVYIGCVLVFSCVFPQKCFCATLSKKKKPNKKNKKLKQEKNSALVSRLQSGEADKRNGWGAVNFNERALECTRSQVAPLVKALPGRSNQALSILIRLQNKH